MAVPPEARVNWRRRVGWALGVVVVLLLIILPMTFRAMQRDWAQALQDESPARRAAAVRAMPLAGNEHLLATALQDDDSAVRLLATDRLGEPGGKESERALALVGALKDGHAGVRREAAWALGELGPGGWAAVREALRDPHPHVRAGAALALCDAYQHKEACPWPSRHAAEAIPVLTGLLQDKEPVVRVNAQRALECLKRKDPTMRRAVSAFAFSWPLSSRVGW